MTDDCPKPPQGTPLFVRGYAQARIATMDPRNAMARSLAAYLRAAEFQRGGGEDVDTLFQLEEVLGEWPDPSVELVKPVASVIDSDRIPYEAHSLTPSPCEDTVDLFCPGTMLWKTAEAAAVFQVDFWCQDPPTREAIAANLPALFSPGETRSGVLLQGDPEYFDRAVRATLLDHKRMDERNAVFQNERRLWATVRMEVPVVHLRNVAEYQPQTQTKVLEATDPNGD